MRTGRDRVLRQHDDLRADLNAVVKIDHVFIGEADAAARDLSADGARRIGAVNTKLRSGDVHRARPKWITGTARGHAWQIRLSSKHFRRRIPVRPFGLALNRPHSGPGEAFATDADAVTDRLAATEHVVEISVRRIDNDGTRCLAAAVADDLALQSWVKLHIVALVSRRGLGNLRSDLGWSGRGEESEEWFGIRNVARQRGSGCHRGERN